MRNNVIPLALPAGETALGEGTVRAITETAVVLETAQGVLSARRAFGCVVAPRTGDTVLFSRGDAGSYVLAVLERPEANDAELEFPADVRLRSRAGTVSLAAAQDLQLSAGARVDVAAASLNTLTAATHVQTGELTAACETARLNADEAQLEARTLSVLAADLLTRVKRWVRWVEDAETATVGNLVQLVRQVFSLNAKDAVVTAKRDMKIDGERIHMG